MTNCLSCKLIKLVVENLLTNNNEINNNCCS